jgi:hypothetical protein
MELRILLVSVVAGTLVGWSQPSQTKRPDFSGTWTEDAEASKALTEKMGHTWRVAGASSGGGAPAGTNRRVIRQVTDVTQSDTELILESRSDKEVVSRIVLKLDGRVSVNASRNSSSRSTSVWKGSSLVTTGTTVLDFSDGSFRTASGQPIKEIRRKFVTTRTLMPDGSLQVENRSKEDGKEERVRWSVLVRVKPD